MEKRNFFKFCGIFIIVFGLALTFMFLTDPFYQYHTPLEITPIFLDNAVYQTPGAARNLEYKDAIIGTSMTENFHTSWFDEELGWKTVKLSYSGARSDDLGAILGQVFSSGRKVDHIIMDVNHYQLTEPSWTAYTERPKYLYDKNPLNDAEYLLNIEVAEYGVERLLDGLAGVQDNMDTAYTWENDELFGKEIALGAEIYNKQAYLDTPTEPKKREEALTVCDENLANWVHYIKEHPETEFLIFFPPYSMLYWEQRQIAGDLETTIEIYRHAIDTLLLYDNVTIYYFQDEWDIITDLNNYRDAAHHRPEYNRYIFECIRDGRNELTYENEAKRLQAVYEFAKYYDYSSLWEE